jgi:hypothetical protein
MDGFMAWSGGDITLASHTRWLGRCVEYEFPGARQCQIFLNPMLRSLQEKPKKDSLIRHILSYASNILESRNMHMSYTPLADDLIDGAGVILGPQIQGILLRQLEEEEDCEEEDCEEEDCEEEDCEEEDCEEEDCEEEDCEEEDCEEEDPQNLSMHQDSARSNESMQSSVASDVSIVPHYFFIHHPSDHVPVFNTSPLTATHRNHNNSTSTPPSSSHHRPGSSIGFYLL